MRPTSPDATDTRPPADAPLSDATGARLRQAVRAARLGLWTIDLSTGLHTRDATLNRLLGLDPAETTQPFDDFVAGAHPDDRASLTEAFARAARDGTPLNVEFRVVWPDGTVRWLRDQGDVSEPVPGAGMVLAGAVVDVTDRRAAEDAAWRGDEQLRRILDSATDYAVLTLAPDRTVTSWSPGAEATFGYAAGEVVGRSGDVLFTPEDRVAGEPGREAEAARRDGRAADERFHLRKDGTRFYASGVLTPLGPGGAGGFVKVARDLTDRKRMEDELRAARDRLEETVAALREAGRRKDELLATLAHELRNPLAPLRNAVALLRLDPPPDEVGRAVGMMERQLGQLVHLVDDLLDVARVTTGKVALRRERVDLRGVVDAAVETSRPVAEAHRHAVAVRAPGGPVWVDGDRVRLAQVVTNLLTNACKYTPDGGRVELTAEAAGGHAVVRVADTGVGIPADMLGRVFEVFTQVAPTGDRAAGGLGLGLALVRTLVELHGEAVWAESPGPGLGSTFTVRLPLAE